MKDTDIKKKKKLGTTAYITYGEESGRFKLYAFK